MPHVISAITLSHSSYFSNFILVINLNARIQFAELHESLVMVFSFLDVLCNFTAMAIFYSNVKFKEVLTHKKHHNVCSNAITDFSERYPKAETVLVTTIFRSL
jgi:hypothetical protein